ncbi:MAG: Preprotein translocase, SecG subunit [Parcubacteria group bacterium GW2011_GWB1_52_7]|nr:MAG: Preprotein translocase, SecG subunit [Parcubacteria group bacterium GW2011_GWA1_51_12]KKW27499.1 MAG: Preprotein translocase, SecG subunit [Parcubacteria group bacterium GW2011_GWB1_52_7]KKW31248.1 MAG: Preprotein translocase, SecG subunit [Parcubacteria group bacterium GW2011_GWC2_52_8c]
MSFIKPALPIIQIILAVLVVVSILLQQRGSGLSTAFGGDGNIYRTKRGVEKSIFRATIILTILLAASAVLNVIIS